MNNTVKMNLEGQQAAALGVPQPVKKIINPFYDANEMERNGDRKGAERIYIELLNSDFQNPVVSAALGMNYAGAGKTGLAHCLLQSALRNIDGIPDAFKRLGVVLKEHAPGGVHDFLKMKKSEICNAIGTCYKQENLTDKAREYFNKAQDLMPPNADIQNNLGTLYINEGRPDLALKHLEQALTIQPDHAQSRWNRSLCYLEQGDYARGFDEYDWGFRAEGVRLERDYTKVPLPRWDGSKGKRIVVHGEQGIGDEIMFASLLPQLIEDSELVVFDCHKKLHRLFANSFPTIDIYPTREDFQLAWPYRPNGQPRYDFTHKISIGSLAKFYRRSTEDFPGTPYIQPTIEAEVRWNERLSVLPPGPKIGIHWRGGHKKTRQEVRSIDLEALLPILSQNAQFISLQYTDAEEEVAAFEAKHGIKIHQFPEAAKSPDYNETAGLVCNLDLVITVCTSLVHLAGSMGVPVWVATPSRPAWRYRLDLDYMPWYKSSVLFRQAPSTTNWQPVIDEIASNLQSLLSTTQQEQHHGHQQVA